MAAQEKLFESHVAWVASLRAQYDAMGAANPPVFLHERFNDAIDFEPPVYRSMTGSTGSSTMTDSLSWQSVCDDLDFDVEPTYRSLAAAAGQQGGRAPCCPSSERPSACLRRGRAA